MNETARDHRIATRRAEDLCEADMFSEPKTHPGRRAEDRSWTPDALRQSNPHTPERRENLDDRREVLDRREDDRAARVTA